MTAQPVEMLRKDDGDWVKKSMSYEVEGARGRPRMTWSHVVNKRGTWENVVWKGRMYRSMRSGGNCCGKPAANPVYKAGKTVVKWLLLVTGKGEIKIRRERLHVKYSLGILYSFDVFHYSLCFGRFLSICTLKLRCVCS